MESLVEPLEELRLLNAKIDALYASADDDEAMAAHRDEEEARRHDEEAFAVLRAAKAARDDEDEEDAARHDETAAKHRADAVMKRTRAMEWHASMEKKMRDAKDEDAANKHKESTKRMEEEAAKSKGAYDEAMAARESAMAARLEAAKRADDEDMMAQMFATFLRARGHEDGEEDAKSDDPRKRKVVPMDEDMMGMFMRAMMKAMTFSPGVTMGKKRKAAAVHDDKMEDMALIKEMLKKHDKGDMAAGTADMRVRRDMRELRASVELLTDAVKRLTGLATDGMQQRRGLVTDGNNGMQGGLVPTRRTMQATGEHWVDKYAESRQDVKNGKMTHAQLQAFFKEQGITSVEHQIARTLELQAAGKLVE